jgi:hypothetical protein
MTMLWYKYTRESCQTSRTHRTLRQNSSRFSRRTAGCAPHIWPLQVASVRTAPGGFQLLLPIHSCLFFSSPPQPPPPPPLNTHTAARPAPSSTAREALLPTRLRASVRPSGLRTKPGGTPSAPPSEMWKLRIVVRAPRNIHSPYRSVYVVTAHSLTAFSHAHTTLCRNALAHAVTPPSWPLRLRLLRPRPVSWRREVRRRQRMCVFLPRGGR